MKSVIISEDIFMKAALEYCRRLEIDPSATKGKWGTNADKYRTELALLSEKINSLKAVGII